MVDHAVAALSRAFGAQVGSAVRRARCTGWSAMPFIGGGYSCAVPGAAELRGVLHGGLEERIFFAGEALGGPAFSTAHGAHLSGIAAAETALARLGGDGA